MNGRGSFPSETDGNPHSQLPRRLAHSGPVRGGTTFTQNPHHFSVQEKKGIFQYASLQDAVLVPYLREPRLRQ